MATDEEGSPDTIESINISRDDALSWPDVVHRTYPSTVNARMDSTIKPFIKKSVEINNTLLDAFNKKLGLPEGTLVSKHALEEHTSSEARCIKAPPNQHLSNVKVSLDAHSDYGTIVSLRIISKSTVLNDPQTFLHNRVIGGLQVLLPGTEEWRAVKVRSRDVISQCLLIDT